MARVAPLDTREISGPVEPELGLFRLRRYAFQPYLQGGSITLDPAGERLYVLDDDAGEVVILDGKSLMTRRRTKVCRRPEQVVAAPSGRAFVTCRGDGKVVRLSAQGDVEASVFLGDEPFGVALTPGGASVLVTTIAKPRVIALATADLATQWIRDLAPEPRGIAIAADGSRAVVAHLVGGVASVVDVRRGYTAAVKLPRLRDGWPSELFEDAEPPTTARVAGGAFAVAASPGGTRVFVPYLLKNDGSKIEDFVPGCYANGADLPIAASVAALDVATAQVLRPPPRPLEPGEEAGSAELWKVSELGRLGTVRAAFHDPVRSRLLTVGEGSSLLMGFDTSKADPTSSLTSVVDVGGAAKGLVVSPDGALAFVHLALSDTLVTVSLDTLTATATALAASSPAVATGEAEVAAALVQKGRQLFYAANDHRLSGFTGVSCASCHLEGRSDGVTWRLDGKPLQTPSLAGRSFAHGRLRWHGDSPSLEHAIGEAIARLGGSGLADAESRALVAFLRSGTTDMERPTRPGARARGERLFADAGCTTCHDPAADYSDGQLHVFRGVEVRTPSLLGVALSAPYYHDGSAPSLAALLRAHEDGNPMAVGKSLTLTELSELERFLASL